MVCCGSAGVVLTGAFAVWRRSPWSACPPIAAVENDARVLRRAISSWQEAHPGDLCPDLPSLRSGGFLTANANDSDPWGTPFRWTCAPEPIVFSIGPDRIRGTLDDVEVPRSARARPPE
jgi:hypothetical protein